MNPSLHLFFSYRNELYMCALLLVAVKSRVYLAPPLPFNFLDGGRGAAINRLFPSNFSRPIKLALKPRAPTQAYNVFKMSDVI